MEAGAGGPPPATPAQQDSGVETEGDMKVDMKKVSCLLTYQFFVYIFF